jgi:hypothetical protein
VIYIISEVYITGDKRKWFVFSLEVSKLRLSVLNSLKLSLFYVEKLENRPLGL